MRRFTLVELMTVLAVVAILTAIAIPSIRSAQMRARQAEVAPNLEGIMASIGAYHLAHDRFPDEAWSPWGLQGKTLQVWQTGTPFDSVGFRPDGDVRAVYAMGTYVGASGCNYIATFECAPYLPEPACAGAIMDMDGDGLNQCAALVGIGADLQWFASTNIH